MSDTAIVLGSAACMRDDVAALSRLCPGILADATIIAVNDAGWVWPRHLHHWVSLHPENFERWEAKRAENGYSAGYTTWSRRNPEWVDRILDHWGAGSSGLYGVTVAYELDIPRIVLCGVPIGPEPHFCEHEKWGGKDWTEYDIHRPGWERRKDRLDGRVKAMSGWTRDLLGAPAREWLDG